MKKLFFGICILLMSNLQADFFSTTKYIYNNCDSEPATVKTYASSGGGDDLLKSITVPAGTKGHYDALYTDLITVEIAGKSKGFVYNAYPPYQIKRPEDTVDYISINDPDTGDITIHCPK